MKRSDLTRDCGIVDGNWMVCPQILCNIKSILVARNSKTIVFIRLKRAEEIRNVCHFEAVSHCALRITHSMLGING